MAEPTKIAVIGDGGWGTALAIIMNAAGKQTSLWGHDRAYLDEMRGSRQNRLFLPGVGLPLAINIEPNLEKILAWGDIIVSAIPSRYLRSVLSSARGAIGPDVPVVSLTKGLDPDSLERPSEVIRETLGSRRIVALSGPSHAEEVARFLPASVVAASDELEAARQIQHIISTPRFRVYASGDMVGVELAGAVKNVIALAAGIIQGMKLGDNALAAVATRGQVEMTRLGVALGGDPATFSGLAGMGDLITTCVSKHSRNRLVGELLAKGKTIKEIEEEINGVPESIHTTSLVLSLAKKHFIDMPITEQVAAVLWEAKSPADALDDLMNRAKKDEY